MNNVSSVENTLLEGDPMAPSSTDVIVQRGYLRVSLPVPDGWRVLTGNLDTSLVYRVAYRYEIEDEVVPKGRFDNFISVAEESW